MKRIFVLGLTLSTLMSCNDKKEKTDVNNEVERGTAQAATSYKPAFEE